MARHPKQRSAVTNGSRLHLEAVPGNSEPARRYRDLLEEAEAERGGRAAMSTAQRSAARAWAGIAVLIEGFHTRIARGDDLGLADMETLGQLGDRLDRQARRMGPVKPPERPRLVDRFARR